PRRYREHFQLALCQQGRRRERMVQAVGDTTQQTSRHACQDELTDGRPSDTIHELDRPTVLVDESVRADEKRTRDLVLGRVLPARDHSAVRQSLTDRPDQPERIVRARAAEPDHRDLASAGPELRDEGDWISGV